MTPFEGPLVNETVNDSESVSHASAVKPARTVEEEVFRSDLNHKLRTPLNAIIGFAELLALKPAGTRQNDDVQQILKSAREMLAIIERELAEPSVDGGDDSAASYKPNTNSMVAFLARFFNSGELAIRPIWLRVRPVAMAMYCLPSTA